MKNFIIIMLLVWMTGTGISAQQSANMIGSSAQITNVFIKGSLTIHFLSPEKITYVDIPKGLLGDLPDKNLLRIKVADSVRVNNNFIGVLTIMGEKRLKQYSIIYDDRPEAAFSPLINIDLREMKLMEAKRKLISSAQLDSVAKSMLAMDASGVKVRAKKYGIKAVLRGVASVGEYLLLDIGYENTTGIPFEIDGVKFRIEDQKQHKATTVQSLDIQPVSGLEKINTFEHTYRNVFVLQRLTFPDHKQLKVELSEKQISGRTISFGISYKDILKAKRIML